MASPFPGMDPFLEDPGFWVSFHFTFINYWSEALGDLLPEEFEVNINERVYLLDHNLRVGPIPVTVLDRPREGYIEILHKPKRSLVAVLEFLSRTNKEEPGRTEYLQKRKTFLEKSVHLVELDLLLSGRRLPMRQPLPRGDYHYFVCRADQRPDCQVYSWSLRDPLPRLPVPLREPYPDLIFDLAAVFNTTYDRGRFGRRLPYGAPCAAPLTAEDRQWVERIVAANER
jgi:uncharacterized protein DUF4058